MKFFKKIYIAILSLSLIIVIIQSHLAETIILNYFPLRELNINIGDLETFAETGYINPKFSFLANRIDPRQLNNFRTLLSQKIDISPATADLFIYSPVGETILKNLGRIIKSDRDTNGFLALRNALHKAAKDRQGLSIVNTLNFFPLDNIYLDTKLILNTINNGTRLLKERQKILEKIKQQNRDRVLNNNLKKEAIEISNRGKINWNKQTLIFQNPHRPDPSLFDLYLPELDKPVPLIIISHGLTSSRSSFIYLAKHLASHGFAVAALEHIGTNSERFNNLFLGISPPPEDINIIEQPRDIKYLLDKLEVESEINLDLKNKINLDRIGAIGQSLGGYTVLGLAGATLNYTNIETECSHNREKSISLIISHGLRCRLQKLPETNYQLEDSRIKAVIAINPLANKIYGKQGMSNIKIPVTIVSGVNDPIAPSVTEQVYPFSWIENKDKFLLLVDKATHFTFFQKMPSLLPIPKTFAGPDPTFVYPGIKFMSTAFFKAYVSGEFEYKNYLNPDYISFFSQEPVRLNLIRSPDNLSQLTMSNEQ